MKIIKLVLLMLVTVVFINAQELDEEFLESLPDDVRNFCNFIFFIVICD